MLLWGGGGLRAYVGTVRKNKQINVYISLLRCLDSHLYGISQLTFDFMNVKKKIDREKKTRTKKKKEKEEKEKKNSD